MSLERKPTESFDDYRARRKAENTSERSYLRGKPVHISKGLIQLTTQEMVDDARKRDPLAKYALNDMVMVSLTLRNPPDTHLDKWQRRKLRKIVQSVKG